MLKSVRIMLAIATFYEIWQMDVKTAFLEWIFLKEVLYTIQPEGFVNPKGANKVCELQRFICGLVQASRSWNIRFDKVIYNIPIFNLDVIHRSSYAYHIYYCIFVVILEILRNSRTQGESWRFHKIFIFEFFKFERRINLILIFSLQLFPTIKNERR